jgi:hypothetical protein
VDDRRAHGHYRVEGGDERGGLVVVVDRFLPMVDGDAVAPLHRRDLGTAVGVLQADPGGRNAR